MGGDGEDFGFSDQVQPLEKTSFSTAVREAASRSGKALELKLLTQQEIADVWGARWRLDVTIRRHGMSAVVGTIWIVRTGEHAPGFVTCWVL